MRINKQIMEVLNHTQWQLTVVEGFKGLAFLGFFLRQINHDRNLHNGILNGVAVLAKC